jgi:hypothetical protein
VSHPVQEEDRIASGKIIATAVISLAIFGVGALWSISIQKAEMGSIVSEAAPAVPTEAGKPEVGIVYQWPFNVSHYANDKAAEKQAWLSTYGWVDKKNGVVHVPIEEAMQKYVATAGGNK